MATAHRTAPPLQPELYRFTRADYLALGVYLLFTVVFTVASDFLAPLVRLLSPNPASASYALNLIFYAGVGILAFIAARRIVARDLRVLATRPWFTLLMIPAALIAMLILTAILVSLGGEVQTSVNQATLQRLMQQVPAWLMVLLLVVLGPFVEEYIFRHLLIGKLSRKLNIWVCCALSVILFAALHIVGQEAITLIALLPYLAMGATLVFVYVWTGKNVMFSYFVHAAKNLMAVVFIYAIPPELLEQMS